MRSMATIRALYAGAIVACCHARGGIVSSGGGTQSRGQARVYWLSHRSLTPIIACVALLALTYFGFGAWRYVAHNYRLSSDEAEIRSDIAELDEQRAQLVAVRDYLKSDEYIEYVARRMFGLVRPGETLVVVSSTAADAAPTATVPPSPMSSAG